MMRSARKDGFVFAWLDIVIGDKASHIRDSGQKELFSDGTGMLDKSVKMEILDCFPVAMGKTVPDKKRTFVRKDLQAGRIFCINPEGNCMK